MPNFLPSDYTQNKLIALNFEDQLQAGTFEYALHHLIEHKLDCWENLVRHLQRTQ